MPNTAGLPPQQLESAELGRRIRQRREKLHMTVQQLAKRLGLSRNTIANYEAGRTAPTANELLLLAGALGCTIEELLCPPAEFRPARFAFRAHAALRKNPDVLAVAQGYLRAYREIEMILNVRLPPKQVPVDLPEDQALDAQYIESVAAELRRKSGIQEAGPENIACVLESLGIGTVFFNYQLKGLDAITVVQDDFILVMLSDRKRLVERTVFSAAHELGHIVLHPFLFTTENEADNDDVKRWEKQADKFAGDFLVPRDQLVALWKQERLDKLPLFHALVLLKRTFRVSFHCLYYRVTELGLHRERNYSSFIAQVKEQLGVTGPAKMEDLEPEPLPAETLYRTTRFDRLVRSAFLQGLIGVSKVAEMFHIPVDEAKQMTAEWLNPRHELVAHSDI